MGELHPSALIGIGLDSARASDQTLRFLGERVDAHASAMATGEAAYLGQRLPRRHDPAVGTLALRFEQPFTWSAFSSAMEALIGLRGRDLLRVKGIVNVEGVPTVVQGVGHVFHPPVALDRWPSDDHGSRLVFITRHIAAAQLRSLFEAVNAIG
jgi:G3E family GTPase